MERIIAETGGDPLALLELPSELTQTRSRVRSRCRRSST